MSTLSVSKFNIFNVVLVGMLTAGPVSAGDPPKSRIGEPLIIAAKIIDGQTLDSGKEHLRLWGIKAPPETAMCSADSGKPAPCSRESADALAKLMGNHHQTCTIVALDASGAPLVRCFALGEAWITVNGRKMMNPDPWFDLAHQMVATGYALADRSVSDQYVADEDKARQAGVGLWKRGMSASWAGI